MWKFEDIMYIILGWWVVDYIWSGEDGFLGVLIDLWGLYELLE